MKERSIIFSAPMVRAILEGRKSQTRRVVKFPERAGKPTQYVGLRERREHVFAETDSWGGQIDCPYGATGDRLWVRETWSKAKSCNCHDIFYRADGETRGKQTTFSFIEREEKWRPSIFMPRHASRILLEVTDVRVERLQNISVADAMAEGITHRTLNDPRVEYRWLWESINGEGSWEKNPWVWVFSFRRVNP